MDISHLYTGEIVRHSDGKNYAVLDTGKLNFDDPQALYGKKIKPVLVRIANPGEEIVTNVGNTEESRTVTQGGEYIFINKLSDGSQDIYVPRDTNGVSIGKQLLEEKYELVGGNLHGEGACFRPKMAPTKILHEVIRQPTCIKNAWGEGQHAFMAINATLKLEGNRVMGINKEAFDETWAITDKMGNISKKKSQGLER